MTNNPNPTYLNFDLLITRAGDAYRAYVVDAPGGDADVTFEMPFAPDELVRLVHGEGARRGLLAGHVLVNTSALVMSSQPGAELACRGHNFNLPAGPNAQPRDVVSY